MNLYTAVLDTLIMSQDQRSQQHYFSRPKFSEKVFRHGKGRIFNIHNYFCGVKVIGKLKVHIGS